MTSYCKIIIIYFSILNYHYQSYFYLNKENDLSIFIKYIQVSCAIQFCVVIVVHCDIREALYYI